MGGEKPFDNPKIDNCEGSPPRGRGKVDVGIPMLAPVRITPAWAGKRKTASDWKAMERDHPRVGGEKCRVLSVGRK